MDPANPIHHLPKDLVAEIFSLLDIRALRSLTLVCKDLNNEATRVLYRTVIDEQNPEAEHVTVSNVRTIALFLLTILIRPEPTNHVKELVW